ncbi:MAG: lipopolysaccharide heptosyltransferase II [Pirellulales bacterium]
MKTLAVFLPNWIGDAVMATPTLRALRCQFANTHRIVGVGRPAVVELLEGTQLVDEAVLLDPQSRRRDRGMWAAISTLRRRRPDLAVLLTGSWRTGLVALLGRARRRYGYAREGRGLLLTDRLVPERRDGKYVPGSVVTYYLRLAGALGCDTSSLTLELATSAEDERRADEALARLGVPRDARIVVVNNSGAFGAAKLWPTTHFAGLSRRLAEHHPVHVVALCGPTERDMARDICQQAHHRRVVGLQDEPLSLGLSKALVRRAALMVTTDSGPRHFAAAFDTPVVTLFGPTHIAWSENFSARATHLQLPVDCGPCQQRVCPLSHHHCMRNLSVDSVYEAAAHWLTRSALPQLAGTHMPAAHAPGASVSLSRQPPKVA